MKSQLTVLHIEDCKEDSELIRQLLLANGFTCNITRVESRAQVFDALETSSYDLILADCKLPGFSGQAALEIAHALKPEVPFIFVSGTIGEETAIESLRSGATDYVLKDRLSRLAPAVSRALAEAEERNLCRQLQQRLHEAGRLEAISTLSNGIAHDFNNILTIILGHASLLTTEYNKPERVLEIGGTISEAARRGSEIVQQLLAFARKSSGHAAPADLNHYVQVSLNVLKEKLPPRVKLVFKPSPELPSVLVDASQLERILLNLVTNSVDAMAGAGQLTISTELVSASELPGSASELTAEKYVRLTLADTGKGIDPATREHVFEPFFTTKERGRGTGLGLPVVYGLMLAHQGFVDIQSEPDHGTTISLFFPGLKSQVPNQPQAASSSDPAISGSEMILVVEDEPDVSFFLETMLRSHGYRVICAADSDAALKVFEARADDVAMVFTDIGLPRMDGITLGEKLRVLKPGLPIILASGYPTREFTKRINKLGPDAFLSKPYNTRDILQTVRNVLDGATALHMVN